MDQRKALARLAGANLAYSQINAGADPHSGEMRADPEQVSALEIARLFVVKAKGELAEADSINR